MANREEIEVFGEYLVLLEHLLDAKDFGKVTIGDVRQVIGEAQKIVNAVGIRSPLGHKKLKEPIPISASSSTLSVVGWHRLGAIRMLALQRAYNTHIGVEQCN